MISEKIKSIISEYKKSFSAVNADERYKWEAIKCYKENWNINADNFADMLKSSFKQAYNLLNAGMYFPRRMLEAYAEEAPEVVRELFRNLYDEKRPFIERYMEFRAGFDKRWPPKGLNHYQDMRAVSVYISFEYPEKYFMYKYKMYKAFKEEIGYTETTGNKDDEWKWNNYLNVCALVLEEVSKDEELQKMSKSRLTDNCYRDEGLHILTHDIIYFGSRLKEKQEIENFWPSLEYYNPNLTKGDWINYLTEVELENHPSPMIMLKAMLELDGEASCKQLAQIYGGKPTSYNGCAVNLGKRVKKYFQLPACMDQGQERYFPIAFLGKSIVEDGVRSYIYRLRPELEMALNELDLSGVPSKYVEDEEEEQMSEIIMDVDKNTILYGPPGTGKTYNTVKYAVAIIENESLEKLEAEKYEDVLVRYHSYKEEGFIEFTTFHQSYAYEEFVEGIKPVINNGSEEKNVAGLQYKVTDGVFKAFCHRANNDLTKSFDESWNKLVETAVAQGNKYTFVRRSNSTLETELRDEASFVVTWSGGTTNIVTKARVWEQWKSNLYAGRDDFDGGRKWMLEANQAVIDTLVGKYGLPEFYTEKKNHVFIIDEINRGNISKIFGELITLIEPSKRLGQKEEIKVKLPYSGQLFGVPDNVYIIGTMNTADRSIAQIDTALRRRFEFKEMLPNSEILSEVFVEDISVKVMLERMNQRISVLYDREHTIGHAYFMPLIENNSLEMLAKIFKNKIIPLLQEYFYEDYEKIRLVLGDNRKEEENQFIRRVIYDYDDLFGNAEYNAVDNPVYEINIKALGKREAYLKI